MKRINELKQEREQLIKEMDAIVTLMETEKRSLTDDETLNREVKEERVNQINKDLEILEKQERQNLSIITNSTKDNVESVTKRYNLGKAIREAGRLTGLEKEMHDEAKRELVNTPEAPKGENVIYLPSMLIGRSGYTPTDGVTEGHVPTFNTQLDINVPTPLYREIGTTVYENLSTGKLDLPFSKGQTASRLDVGTAASRNRATRTKDTLSATRYQGFDLFSNEYLAESTVFPQVLSDMVASIDRAVGKDLIVEATDINSGGTSGVTSFEAILSQIATLNNEDFTAEGLILSKELFFNLASKVQTDGDAKKVIELLGKNKGRFAGIDAFGTSFLPEIATGKYQYVYGDWKRAIVGFWGGVQLLVNPYTYDNEGEVKVTYSRLADVAVNPYTFVSQKNVTLV